MTAGETATKNKFISIFGEMKESIIAIDQKLLETYRKLRSTKTEATKRESIALIDKLLDQRNQQKKP